MTKTLALINPAANRFLLMSLDGSDRPCQTLALLKPVQQPKSQPLSPKGAVCINSIFREFDRSGKRH